MEGRPAGPGGRQPGRRGSRGREREREQGVAGGGLENLSPLSAAQPEGPTRGRAAALREGSALWGLPGARFARQKVIFSTTITPSPRALGVFPCGFLSLGVNPRGWARCMQGRDPEKGQIHSCGQGRRGNRRVVGERGSARSDPDVRFPLRYSPFSPPAISGRVE